MYLSTEPKHGKVTYTFSTPASDLKRQISLSFEAAYDSSYFFKVSFDAPFKRASAEAGLKKNEKEFAMYAAATNDNDEYLAKFGFDVTGNAVRAEYKPTILIKDPKSGSNSVGGYTVDGSIVVENNDAGARYTFQNLKIQTPSGAPYVVNGFISRQARRVDYDLKFELNTEKKQAQVKGAFESDLVKGYGKFLFDLALTSDFHEAANGQFKYDFERRKGSLVSLNAQSLTVNATITLFFFQLKNDFLFVYGKDLASSKNRLHIYQNAKYTKGEDEKLSTVDSEFKIDAPSAPFNLEVTNNFKVGSFAKFDFKVGSGANKLNIYSDNKYNAKAKGDFDIILGGSLNEHNGKLVASRVVGDKLSDIKAQVSSSCGFGFDLSGKVSNEVTPEKANIDVQAVTTLPNKKDTPYT